MLMSGLGVADSAFFRLQESMIQRLAEMLINEEQAAIALSQVNTAKYNVFLLTLFRYWPSFAA